MSSKTWIRRDVKKPVSNTLSSQVFQGPTNHTTYDSGKQSFPVSFWRLPHISFPLGASCWLGPVLCGYIIFIPEAVNSCICLVSGRCQTSSHVEMEMDSLPYAHHKCITHILWVVSVFTLTACTLSFREMYLPFWEQWERSQDLEPNTGL